MWRCLSVQCSIVKCTGKGSECKRATGCHHSGAVKTGPAGADVDPSHTQLCLWRSGRDWRQIENWDEPQVIVCSANVLITIRETTCNLLLFDSRWLQCHSQYTYANTLIYPVWQDLIKKKCVGINKYFCFGKLFRKISLSASQPIDIYRPDFVI